MNFSSLRNNIEPEKDELETAFDDCSEIVYLISESIGTEDEWVASKLEEVRFILETIKEHVNLTPEQIISEEELSSSMILPSLIEVYRTGEPVDYTLLNGDTLTITPELAEELVYLHDNLDEDNQQILVQNLSESAESFEVVLDFLDESTNRNRIVDATNAKSRFKKVNKAMGKSRLTDSDSKYTKKAHQASRIRDKTRARYERNYQKDGANLKRDIGEGLEAHTRTPKKSYMNPGKNKLWRAAGVRAKRYADDREKTWSKFDKIRGKIKNSEKVINPTRTRDAINKSERKQLDKGYKKHIEGIR